jgi:hypothetical protein
MILGEHMNKAQSTRKTMRNGPQHYPFSVERKADGLGNADRFTGADGGEFRHRSPAA